MTKEQAMALAGLIIELTKAVHELLPNESPKLAAALATFEETLSQEVAAQVDQNG